MVWTLSTINKKNISYLLICFLLAACGQQKTLSDIKLKKKKTNPSKPIKKRAPLIFGPQNPNLQKGLVEKSKQFGLGEIKATHFYAVHLNKDRFIDLVVIPEFYSIPLFYIYDQKQAKFIKLKASPFTELEKASFLEFSDYNRDGIIDMLMLTLNQRSALKLVPPKLFMGSYDKKGDIKFREHPFSFPLEGFASVSVFDFNQDGLLDIYFGNWFDVRKRPPQIRPNRFFVGIKSKKNKYGFEFNEISDQFQNEWKFDQGSSRYPNARPTFGTGLCDINFDGRSEIFNANTGGYSNRLWGLSKIEGREIFIDVAENTPIASDQIGAHLPLGGGHTFYLNCHDYNQSGFFDIAIGELFHSYDLDSKDRSSILTGANNKVPYQFIRTEYHQDDGTSSWDQGDRRSVWLDVDANGFSDLIIDNSGFPPKSRLVAFIQGTDGSYADLAKQWGIDHLNPSGTITLDVNNDGLPDLLSGQTNIRDSRIKSRSYLYLNKNKKKGQSLIINFDSYSRGKAFEVTYSNGSKQKLMVESTNGPQSSQSQSRLHLFARKGTKFSSVRNPIFGKAPEVINLKKDRQKPTIVLHYCDGSLRKRKCSHL